ncbi:MAG: ADP-forming succinate--CoA ligase subunit beta [Clostridiales bacterium]|nr:ADP-forming succinate--CoA ligase subunit beta [Clostridiales bacterium]
MKIHEHQALDLLGAYGVPNAGGAVAFTAGEAAAAAQGLPRGRLVVKAQIHAGGRGKAGGVRLADSPEQVGEIAAALLGSTLVTPQTGPAGRRVNRLLVTPAVDIAREFYLGLLLDMDSGCTVLMASAEGGTEIEEVAKHRPERILRARIDPLVGLRRFQLRNLTAGLGLSGQAAQDFEDIAQALYRLFVERDCSLVELNPLVETAGGRLLALDAKLSFDDSALFRHPDLAALRDPLEEDPREVEASALKLSYIPLEGSIGCMVNGAGLAMATMDLIQAQGAQPANFLDVGGGAGADKVAGAFRLLLGDGNVRGILVNIFGGIMRCDQLAEGIVEAARRVELALPLVVRLRGTNAEQGARILADSALAITPENDLKRAVETIVRLTGGAGR